MIVGLIACGGAKRAQLCAARDLYTGSLFRANRAWIERNTPRWAILSAKHGVLDPRQPVVPYKLKLKDFSPAELTAWGERVREQLRVKFPQAEFLILGGTEYRSALEGLPHFYPMSGLDDMRFGKQLAWLKRNPAWRRPESATLRSP